LRDLLQACHAVEEAVRVSAQFALRLLDGACGAIYLLDPGRSLLERSTFWGVVQQSEEVFGKDDCWSLRRGRPFFGTGGEHGLCCAHVKRMPGNGYACVPLAAQGETFGLMHMQCDVDIDAEAEVEADASAQAEASAHRGGYAGRRRHIAGTIAEYLSLAIANVRMRESLRRQATRDALTGLYNRRQMDEILDREIRRAARHQRELVLMMIDIDHFKRINDVHGHEVGDLVLREVAQCIQRQVRVEDYAFRYGGEEFLLMLPDANPEQIGARAETILEAVRHLRLSWMGQPLDRVSVSLGVAAFPAHGHNAADLVRAADGALLKAKAAGRDRLETASASVIAQLELGTRIGAIV
jgi:diguanylate cyclase (GGDEF)-like protein